MEFLSPTIHHTFDKKTVKILSETGDMDITCNLCITIFVNKTDLRKHMSLYTSKRCMGTICSTRPRVYSSIGMIFTLKHKNLP